MEQDKSTVVRLLLFLFIILAPDYIIIYVQHNNYTTIVHPVRHYYTKTAFTPLNYEGNQTTINYQSITTNITVYIITWPHTKYLYKVHPNSAIVTVPKMNGNASGGIWQDLYYLHHTLPAFVNLPERDFIKNSKIHFFKQCINDFFSGMTHRTI